MQRQPRRTNTASVSQSNRNRIDRFRGNHGGRDADCGIDGQRKQFPNRSRTVARRAEFNRRQFLQRRRHRTNRCLAGAASGDFEVLPSCIRRDVVRDGRDRLPAGILSGFEDIWFVEKRKTIHKPVISGACDQGIHGFAGRDPA